MSTIVSMLTDKAIALYGNRTALARALGITRSAVHQWGKYVPELRQYQLERITDGKLRVAKRPKRAAA
jgi:transcriptional repressor of cell division inhibition gene dicB